MPQKFGSLTLDLVEIPENECRRILLNFPWNNTSGDETLTFGITCLKWTFNYDFWIKVNAHPEGNQNISKQIDNIKQNPLLELPSEAPNDYKDFLEPHLNSHQLHIFGELLDFLF